LLEDGKLPCRKVGTHRRVLFRDVLALKRRNEDERREALRALEMGY